MPPDSTRFDPMITAVVRHAEGIYTKMGIKRDESEDLTRRKKKDDGGGTNVPTWEDETDVSIQALKGFLEDLLGLSHAGLADENNLPLSPASANTQSSAPDTVASQAARAYRTTGRMVHDENVDTPPPVLTPPDENVVTLDANTSDEDKARLKSFIGELSALERQGITHLTLSRSQNFIDSIETAINQARI